MKRSSFYLQNRTTFKTILQYLCMACYSSAESIIRNELREQKKS